MNLDLERVDKGDVGDGENGGDGMTGLQVPISRYFGPLSRKFFGSMFGHHKGVMVLKSALTNFLAISDHA